MRQDRVIADVEVARYVRREGLGLVSPHIVFPVLGLLLMALGWPMAARRVRPNRWYGLRVPATFADEKVWYDANAVAGRDMMVLGGVIAAVALVLPGMTRLSDGAYAAVCAGLLGLGALISTARAWRLANRLLRARRPGADAT